MSRPGRISQGSAALGGTKLVNLRNFQIPSCAFLDSSGINNSPRACVWLAGRFSATLVRVRHLNVLEGLRSLNCPGHGTCFGNTSRFLKGTFKARTSKSKIFSQFSVFRFGACAEISDFSKRKAILLRFFELLRAGRALFDRADEGVRP